ncbi:MAG TPA: tetratricopeptide repeat protein [Burkholderiales bacterium]|nr:tetratricopeptide repeat protein [Burkholderiales bacterium]
MLFTLLRALFARAKAPPRLQFADVFRLYAEGRLDEAERACATLDDAPRADVDYLLGLIAQARGEIALAAERFGAAVRARGEEATFHYSLGEALAKLERYEGAAEQFERFAELADTSDPRCVKARLYVADCRAELGDEPGARRWYERATTAAGSDPAALTQVVFALRETGRVEEARDVQSHAIRVRQDLVSRVRRALLIPAIYDSREEIDAVRRRFSAELDELLRLAPAPVADPDTAVGTMPFYLAYHNAANRDLLRKLCAVMRRVYRAPTDPLAPPRTSGRLRIGFVSTYFFKHSAGRVTIGLIRDLPRDRFEVHVFAVDPPNDAMRPEYERAADHYRAFPRAIEEVRAAIAAAKLDVLVFADIGMHPTTYFLALCRLAPIQVAWWGHSETSGVDTVDYYLSADAVEIESAQDHYSETLVRPKAFFLPGFERPTVAAPASRESLGLPPGRSLYACLQTPFKIHPDMDAVLAAILERDARADIALLGRNGGLRDRLRRRFARTIGPDAARIRFLPNMSHERYLATLAAADVVLDPLYFGGCNSSCEALALGVPVVTLPGTHLFGRFTLGLYEEMGLRDCIVGSTDAYVGRAVQIASERERREDLAREIANRSAVLFDRKDLTLAFAGFLEGAVRSGPRHPVAAEV